MGGRAIDPETDSLLMHRNNTFCMVLLYAAQLLSRILAKEKDQDKDEEDSIPEDSI